MEVQAPAPPRFLLNRARLRNLGEAQRNLAAAQVGAFLRDVADATLVDAESLRDVMLTLAEEVPSAASTLRLRHLRSGERASCQVEFR
jgi:hypothetical protein